MSRKPFSFTFTLYWSPDHNVPILNPQLASKYSSFFIRIRLTEPGDVRIAFLYDVLIIREAIFREFNDWKVVDLLIPHNSIVLLNKIPGYPDEADEVIVNGELIGHRWYDPIEKVWRFRPVFQGVSKIIDNKIGYYAIVDLPKLKRGFEIHRDRIVSANLPPKKNMIVAITTKDGKWQGIARLVRSKRLYVVKCWRSVKSHYLDSKSSIKDIVDINIEEIEKMYENSIKFLKKVFTRYPNYKVVVSYSGGKDSLVALDIVNDVCRDYYVLFNDTTLELPDTYRNVFEVCNRYGVDVRWARARTNFFNIVNMFSLPSRDFRYCCKMLKLAPISKTLKTIAPTGSLSITGQRKYESSLRARLPTVSKSRWVANTVVVAPINEWTSLHIWLYVFWRELPYNKAYEKGFDRIGCWICPANELAEIELACRHYSNLSELWNNVLDTLGLRDIIAKCGLWRWRTKVPGDVKRFIESRFKKSVDEVHSKYVEDATPIRLKKENSKIIVTLTKITKNTENYIPRIIRFLKTLRDIRDILPLNSQILVILKDSKIILEIHSNDNIIIKADEVSRENIVSILRVIARSFYCSLCGLCESWCYNNAITVSDDVYIDHSKCSRCGLCLLACPVSEYLISRSGILKHI